MSLAHVAVPSCPNSVFASPEDALLGHPIGHVSDGNTDLEVLKSVPKQFEIVDEKSANWLIRRIMNSRSYATRVKEWAEGELRRAAREEHTLLFLFGRQIENWTKEEIAKMKGKRKSLNLPAGCVGFRAQPTRVVVDDESLVLNWAKKSLPSAVVVVEKLSKSVLNEHCEKTGELPEDGIHVEPAAEKFFIR